MNIYEAVKSGMENGASTMDTILMQLRSNEEDWKKVTAEFECVKYNNTSIDESSEPSKIMEFLRTAGALKDPVGGIHDECLGWSPNGDACGECGEITCALCTVWQKGAAV